MKRNEMIEKLESGELEQIVAEAFDKYEYVGIRASEEPISGEYCKLSYVWDDDEPTNERLEGTCAVRIQDCDYDSIAYAIRIAKTYGCENYYIVAGNDASDGHDDRSYDEDEILLNTSKRDKWGRVAGNRRGARIIAK